jgi:hypothetical protein
MIMTNAFKSKKMAYACPSSFAAVWLGVALLLAILLTSCGLNKYDIAAGLPNPDTAYMTGTVAGHNLYIWECYQGKHIVIYQEAGEMWASLYTREESLCGSQTAIEIKLADIKPKREIDPQLFWK